MGLATDAINRLGLPPDQTKAYLDLMPTAYAMTYIFGTVGSAIVIAMLGPLLLRINLRKACKEYEDAHGGKRDFGGLGDAWQRVRRTGLLKSHRTRKSSARRSLRSRRCSRRPPRDLEPDVRLGGAPRRNHQRCHERSRFAGRGRCLRRRGARAGDRCARRTRQQRGRRSRAPLRTDRGHRRLRHEQKSRRQDA